MAIVFIFTKLFFPRRARRLQLCLLLVMTLSGLIKPCLQGNILQWQKWYNIFNTANINIDSVALENVL